MTRPPLYTLMAAALLSTTMAAPALADTCPPGLAKKAVPCVPPGQAKKHTNHDRKQQTRDHAVIYTRGDRIDDSHARLTDPTRYGLNPDRSYVVVENQVYRIDPDTRAVLNIIGALSQLSR
ncbi:excinuclease ABC subunit A [Antarctobacter sp.]|uniref:excinuclease ABC subunit A n=1 Tax=Antarctobacter sp. TaxID=1872577 RepID=UPI002B266AAA|nr:excinuclease ABC subunit A [Antarctobacter sp.]